MLPTTLLSCTRRALSGAAVRLRTALVTQERGDVPGWVLVTLMTAGLVIALWAVAGPALTEVFTNAIDKVTGAI